MYCLITKLPSWTVLSRASQSTNLLLPAYLENMLTYNHRANCLSLWIYCSRSPGSHGPRSFHLENMGSKSTKLGHCFTTPLLLFTHCQRVKESKSQRVTLKCYRSRCFGTVQVTTWFGVVSLDLLPSHPGDMHAHWSRAVGVARRIKIYST